jgi:predicted nuclease of restriction endonuclease-like RecB superfamily
MALRKLMRRLKFYRLLAEVKRVSATEISLTLSGPAAIFGENRKYGLQLAAFFPVILLLEKWKIRAELSLRGKDSLVLNLDSRRCTLKSPLQHWAAYVPDEVALFIKAFRAGSDQWREAAEADLPVIRNTGKIFPDFSFARVDDPSKIVHVELFHRCYNDVLEDRLAFLEETPDFPLVIGIDRSALGKNGEKVLQEKFPSLEDHAFFFSNYPGAERVRKMLDKVCAATEKLL